MRRTSIAMRRTLPLLAAVGAVTWGALFGSSSAAADHSAKAAPDASTAARHASTAAPHASTAALRAAPAVLAAPAILVTPAPAQGSPRVSSSNDELREEVRRAEAAFAKTMADRDHAAFVALIAEEAIFVSPRRTLRGKQAIADGWKKFYEGKEAPFSWAPDKVEVLDSGTLALSQGPVMDPSGKRVGTFNSTWRRESGGRWKIVLDNGCPDCECPPAPGGQGK